MDIPENLKKGKVGGKRKGSGRKPIPLFKARDKFNDLIDSQWGQIQKNIKKWILEGDKEMTKYFMDQRFGRSAQSVDITSGGNEINTMSYEQAQSIIREREGGNKSDSTK